MQARTILISIVSLCVSGLAHALLGSWLLEAFPKLRARKRQLIAVLTALVFLGTVTRFITLTTRSSIAGAIFGVAMCEAIIVLFSAIPLVLVRAAGRAAAHFAPKTSPKSETDDKLTRRQVLERGSGLVVLGATTSLVGWGAAKGRYEFVVDEVSVRIPGLPRALDGYTIAQISDIHIGLQVGERDIAGGLEKLAATKSDLIVITGDMVDFDPRYVPEMARIFSRIVRSGGAWARDGVYAIYGNHDHYTGADEVGRALRAIGIDVLVNDGRVIRPNDGGGFALLGVDDLAAKRHGGEGPRLDLAEKHVPDDRPRILLSHQPHTVDFWAGRVALQLSGHTHGGQFNPGFRPADFVMRYVAGRYDVGGSTLWVNRGFGVVGPPARVGAPPEVTKIVLVAA